MVEPVPLMPPEAVNVKSVFGQFELGTDTAVMGVDEVFNVPINTALIAVHPLLSVTTQAQVPADNPVTERVPSPVGVPGDQS